MGAGTPGTEVCDGVIPPGDTRPTGVRVLIAFVVAATLVLLLVVVASYQPPSVPPLSQMEEARSGAPRLTEKCESSNGGGAAPTTSCLWYLSLDGETWLDWPWTKQPGDVGRIGAYLHTSAPITVRFWRGKVFQIVTNDGNVYLDYNDAAGWERSVQLMGVWFGVVVTAASTANVGLCAWWLLGRAIPKKVEALPVVLYGVMLVGALLLCFGRGPVWWGVPGLALFSAAAGVLMCAVGRRPNLQDLE